MRHPQPKPEKSLEVFFERKYETTTTTKSTRFRPKNQKFLTVTCLHTAPYTASTSVKIRRNGERTGG
jgi:hypothetical protein